MIVAITTMVAMLLSKEPKKIPWTREMALLMMFWIVDAGHDHRLRCIRS